MFQILAGLLFIALSIFDRRQLKNKDSWWAWTNIWARGHRDALGDEGHKDLATVKSVLLFWCGVFLIVDKAFGLGILPDSRG